MAGRARAIPTAGEHAKYRVAPADEADIRRALEDVEAGRMVDLSPDELAAWEATGELPASVVARFAALECNESHG